jgi:hypothetical protein
LSKLSSNSPDIGTNLNHNMDFDAIDVAIGGVENKTASGAINNKEGTVFLNGSGVVAATLALPTAGLPSAGGDDGRRLTIQASTAHAHTVTTPSSGLNGASHVATFGGAVGDTAELVAFNGGWLVKSLRNVTLS